MLTFGLSLLWIGGFAFLLVWWTDIATRLGISSRRTLDSAFLGFGGSCADTRSL